LKRPKSAPFILLKTFINKGERVRVRAWLWFFRTHLLGENLQNDLVRPGKKYLCFLLIGLLAIVSWQYLFFLNRGKISKEHRRRDTSGFSYHFAHHFLYFYYYKGLFPVASTRDSKFSDQDYSTEGADRIIEEHGDSLVMEWGHWSRLGENARIFCFLPTAWIWGTAARPSIIPFNALLFVFSLLLTWIVFWYYRKPFLGLFIVLLVGSSPFCLYETYGNQNIFGLLPSNALILLSLHLPLFSKKFRIEYLLVPFISGLLIGTFVLIRAEVLPIISSCLVSYWINKKITRQNAALLSVVLILSFYGTKNTYTAYFDHKFKEAYHVVEENGGSPYIGGRITTHRFWHPVFVGLGDYDTKYGYVWKDASAYAYAVPVLKEKYGMNLNYAPGKLWIDDYYDEQKWYYRKFDEIPEYEEVVKEKVLRDIGNDPGWFATIMSKRIFGVFAKTSPVQINVVNLIIPVPFSGLVVIPVLFLLFWCRAWLYIKLVAFTFPLAATSLIVYGGSNSTYNSIYHLLLAALIFSWLMEYALIWRKQKEYRFMKKTMRFA